jgi:LysR family nitrogen assimilation transcriptional regulator
MRIRQLEYFTRVCETGSITSAARQLNVAQPALGMQIKALEEELGSVLLDRTKRGTRPTPAGEIFLVEAKHILLRVREVRQRLADLEIGAKTTVKVGLTPSLATVLVSPLLEALSAERPEISVNIYEEFSHVLLDLLERGDIDIALAYSVPAGRTMLRTPLLRETLYFVAQPGSRFDVPGPIEFDLLSDAPFVMPGARDFIRQIVEATMRQQDRKIRVSYEVESMSAMKELIMCGMACGILPLNNVTRELKSGELVARPVTNPPISRILYSTRRADRASKKAEMQVLATVHSLLSKISHGHPALSPIIDE